MSQAGIIPVTTRKRKKIGRFDAPGPIPIVESDWRAIKPFKEMTYEERDKYLGAILRAWKAGERAPLTKMKFREIYPTPEPVSIILPFYLEL